MSVFFSRDLDSLVTAREAAAVSEFLSSDLDFHMMRDHWVQTSKILGGMWGAKLNKGIRPMLKKAMEIILQVDLTWLILDT